MLTGTESAVANGANGDPFNDAKKYATGTRQDEREAVRYYQLAAAASPGSASAKLALSHASDLKAAVKPLNTRFVRIYD